MILHESLTMMKADSHTKGKNVSDEYPKFFYKYREVSNQTDLSKDNALKALINNEAIFSSRKNFNDLFDSKIELINPSARELKELKPFVKKEYRRRISDWVENGKFTREGLAMVKEIENRFNKIIDASAFYSVSSSAVSNLMWSHYARSHSGFCIEFKSEVVRAEKVIYQKTIPQIKTLAMHRYFLELDESVGLGNEIMTALRTKLDEWEYESEYRIHSKHSIPDGGKFIKVSYEPISVESIIFGCRMSDTVKNHIIRVMPKNLKYKQAVEQMSGIEIVSIN